MVAEDEGAGVDPDEVAVAEDAVEAFLRNRQPKAPRQKAKAHLELSQTTLSAGHAAKSAIGPISVQSNKSTLLDSLKMRSSTTPRSNRSQLM